VREKATIRNLKSCALDDRGTGAGAAFVSIPDEGGQQRYAALALDKKLKDAPSRIQTKWVAVPRSGQPHGRLHALRAVCATAQIQGMTPSPSYLRTTC
jgi:hypothetical protein